VNLLENLLLALEGLWANKLRSMLTMLGIIIGVAAVIVVIALGAGGQAVILGELEGLGSNLIWVFPRQDSGHGSWDRLVTMDNGDIQAIEAQARYVKAVSPQISMQSTAKTVKDTKDISATGVGKDYREIRNVNIESGRFFSEYDFKEGNRVAVIGTDVAKSLFDSDRVVGEVFYLNGQQFTVVGVIEERKQGMGIVANDIGNDSVLIPYTAMQRMTGDYGFYLLFATAESSEVTLDAAKEIENILARRHGPNRFEVLSLEQTIDVVEEITSILTAVIAGIAGIALLVGGIGIMNIMLVSVTERTKEIGIRQAIGAKRRDLLYQFLIEALVLSLIGGLLGILVGAGLVKLLTILLELPSLISVSSILLALSFSFVVGMIFGVYPASKASKLDPIEALRYE